MLKRSKNEHAEVKKLSVGKDRTAEDNGRKPTKGKDELFEKNSYKKGKDALMEKGSVSIGKDRTKMDNGRDPKSNKADENMSQDKMGSEKAEAVMSRITRGRDCY